MRPFLVLLTLTLCFAPLVSLGLRLLAFEGAEAFDRRTEAWPGHALFREHFRACLPEGTSLRVLDLMSGTGAALGYLEDLLCERDTHVTALDSSPERLQRAREKLSGLGSRLETLTADVRQGLPFPDASFDVVLMQMGLHHLREKGPVLDEVLRILRPGGHFVFGDKAARSKLSDAAFELRRLLREGRSSWIEHFVPLQTDLESELRRRFEVNSMEFVRDVPGYPGFYCRACLRRTKNA